jgi:deoxyribodipyrimidine photo-lyase
MSRDQRVADNWALLYALEQASASGSPVAVAFNLVRASAAPRRRSWLDRRLPAGAAPPALLLRCRSATAPSPPSRPLSPPSCAQVPAFLGAGARQFCFMLKGLREVAGSLAAINVPFFLTKVGGRAAEGGGGRAERGRAERGRAERDGRRGDGRSAACPEPPLPLPMRPAP